MRAHHSFYRVYCAIEWWWLAIQSSYFHLFGDRYQCACGHRAPWKTRLVINELSGQFTLGNDAPCCPQCFADAAIQCAWCGRTILPEDPVTLFSPPAGFMLPAHAIVYQEQPRLQLVGCLLPGCGVGDVDWAGVWVLPGEVYLEDSPSTTVLDRWEKKQMLLLNKRYPRRRIRNLNRDSVDES